MQPKGSIIFGVRPISHRGISEVGHLWFQLLPIETKAITRQPKGKTSQNYWQAPEGILPPASAEIAQYSNWHAPVFTF